VRPDVVAFHRRVPVVDLLVGSAVFRREFVTRQAGGHADVPRLVAGGIDLVGLSIATRHPDLRGTLSTPQFRALGYPMRRLTTELAIAGAVAGRSERGPPRPADACRSSRTRTPSRASRPGYSERRRLGREQRRPGERVPRRPGRARPRW
jgi:hypothetical protein